MRLSIPLRGIALPVRMIDSRKLVRGRLGIPQRGIALPVPVRAI